MTNLSKDFFGFCDVNDYSKFLNRCKKLYNNSNNNNNEDDDNENKNNNDIPNTISIKSKSFYKLYDIRNYYQNSRKLLEEQQTCKNPYNKWIFVLSKQDNSGYFEYLLKTNYLNFGGKLNIIIKFVQFACPPLSITTANSTRESGICITREAIEVIIPRFYLNLDGTIEDIVLESEIYIFVFDSDGYPVLCNYESNNSEDTSKIFYNEFAFVNHLNKIEISVMTNILFL